MSKIAWLAVERRFTPSLREIACSSNFSSSHALFNCKENFERYSNLLDLHFIQLTQPYGTMPNAINEYV